MIPCSQGSKIFFAITRHSVTVTRHSKFSNPFATFGSFTLIPTHLYQEPPARAMPPAANWASYTLCPAPADRSSPTGFTLLRPHSYGAICSPRSDLVLPRACTTRTRPSSSCTAPRLLDQDRTTQLLYCPAPTRLGSDPPAPVRPRAYVTRIRPARPWPQPEARRHLTWAAQAPSTRPIVK